ncbi:hypothetical protein [Thioalkalivibrio sp. ALE17]|uniref:hypothetical protein n=1 Tax=Thioalkalivibrio sp. ALE17 TaxID=1158173 RepID=UPI0012DDE1AD|nr:hypothetical protein [Thioalkalivibrio sp. ALE17]
MNRRGYPAVFLGRISNIVMLNGLGFGERQWHPFPWAQEELLVQPDTPYGQSRLVKYFREWKPRHAAEAVVGFDRMPSLFFDLPSYAYHHSPWAGGTPEDTNAKVRSFVEADFEEHGRPELSVDVDGFKYHGPVSDALGGFEHRRLRIVLDALRKEGFDESKGRVSVYALKRDGELRFVCRGGVHRLSGMKALSEGHVPVRLCPPYEVDVDEAHYWPGVQNGFWSKAEAVSYFDHLFDFRSIEWAKRKGFV